MTEGGFSVGGPQEDPAWREGERQYRYICCFFICVTKSDSTLQYVPRDHAANILNSNCFNRDDFFKLRNP